MTECLESGDRGGWKEFEAKMILPSVKDQAWRRVDGLYYLDFVWNEKKSDNVRKAFGLT